MSLQLLESIKKSMVDAGASMEKVEAESKDFIERTKANEVVNPNITGQGAEITRLTEKNDTILELVPQYSNFLAALPGFQGVRALTSELPVIADSVLPTGNTSWRDASDVASLDNQVSMLTDSVSITQRAMKVEFPIDRQVLQYGVQGIYERAIAFIRASAARGTEAFIFNADASLTGNVNKDGYDFTPLSAKARDAFYYLGGGVQGGLRKVWLANTAIDLSTFTEDDLFDLMVLLGGFGFDPSSLMFATSLNVKSKIMRFDSYLKAYQNGANPSTAESGKLEKVLGADLHVSRDFPTLAASNGKVHTSTGNTTGSIVLFYKPSVQYAYGQELLIDVTKVAGKGVILTGSFDLGVGIANAKAGMDKTVAMGRNITI